jgi:ABC-type oligopeptide transport system substrate-binding subunit
VTTDRGWAGRATVPGVLVLLLALLAGCTSAEKLHDVSGTATFDGRPIPAGIIYFDPDPIKGGTGTQGFANIHDGIYTTAVNGRGIRGGPYIIRITGYNGKTANEAPLGQPLFDEYEMKKDLPAANSELNFDIPKRK